MNVRPILLGHSDIAEKFRSNLAGQPDPRIGYGFGHNFIRHVRPGTAFWATRSGGTTTLRRGCRTTDLLNGFEQRRSVTTNRWRGGGGGGQRDTLWARYRNALLVQKHNAQLL